MRVLVNDALGALVLEEALPLLPAFRREVALRYRREIDCRQSVAAWLLLRQACREELGLEDVPEVAWMPQGKPYFPGLPGVHFNLSHCAEAAVCVLGDVPVGVDIEAPQPVVLDLMERLMSPAEQAEIRAAAVPEFAFARLWTRKESLLKLSGEGLVPEIDTLLEDRAGVRWQSVEAPSGRYVYTIATYCDEED